MSASPRRPTRRPALLLVVVLGAANAAGAADAGAPDAGSPGVAPSVAVRVQPGVAKPGDPVLITLTSSGAVGAPAGMLGPRPLRFYAIDGGFEALTGLSTDLDAGLLDLKVRWDGVGSYEADAGTPPPERSLAAALEIVEPHFRESQLTVSKKFISPPKSAKAQIAGDRVAFNKAWKQEFSPRGFPGDFAWPRPPAVTAPFGDLRLFNGKKQSQHYGLDLNGETGDPIFAANAGRVVLARDCYASGGTVLIHHGADLFTAYFHMSKILAKPNTRVKQGDLIGLVGKTGRVTGPHLHWGVRVDGLYVNAETLMRLDFDPPPEER